MSHIRPLKPRCYLVYALAPEQVTAAQANAAFNALVADQTLPLVLFHDHFLGQPGGMAIFYVATPAERDTLITTAPAALPHWRVDVQPLIFAYNPAAFDEQTAFTLRTYRATDWDTLRQIKRPAYGNPVQESETAAET
ncbi:MAG: hypothetical protein MI924_17080 [Chloroflexales bacterium]|nr:hypothetical protein [Chloroflexales bacterium]